LNSVKAFKRIISLRPESPRAHHNVAVTFIRKHDKDAAFKEYEVLRGLDTDMAERLLKEINR
jgi:hypothetical protein